jgi:hypothetical protein
LIIEMSFRFDGQGVVRRRQDSRRWERHGIVTPGTGAKGDAIQMLSA